MINQFIFFAKNPIIAGVFDRQISRISKDEKKYYHIDWAVEPVLGEENTQIVTINHTMENNEEMARFL